MTIISKAAQWVLIIFTILLDDGRNLDVIDGFTGICVYIYVTSVKLLLEFQRER